MLDDFLLLKTPNTKRSYKTAVSHFTKWLDSQEIAETTKTDAVRYMAAFKSNHSDATTKHRYNLLRTYFDYLVTMEVVKTNPFKIIPTVMNLKQSYQVRPTKTINGEEVLEVLRGIDRTGVRGKLLFAFIALLFGGGLRRGEALAICSRNLILDDSTGQWHLELNRTKGGRRSLQPIPAWVGLACREVAPADKNQPIFPWSDSTGYRKFKRAFKNSCAPHAMRAAYATLLKINGFGDRETADLLRHKSDAMVKVYDHRFRESLRNTPSAIENFFKN